MKHKIPAWLVGLACIAQLAFGSLAHAQAYPSRAIKLVVPYAAGGLPDTVARIIAKSLGDTLGQAVYVDNRPGAGGSVAASASVRGAPFIGWRCTST